MALLEFIGSQAGRGLRVAAGLTLIAVGIALGGGWLARGAVGLVPLAAGVLDICVLGPLFRLPVVGRSFREAAARR